MAANDVPNPRYDGSTLSLGFGCGDLFGGQSFVSSVKLIETALDCGITHFDTARLYGNGSAETVLGKVLPHVRNRVTITTKVGILPWRMRHAERIKRKAARIIQLMGGRRFIQEPSRPDAQFGAFALRDLKRSLHRSLKELNTDYVDILLLHECTLDHASRPDVLEFLLRARERGQIREFGIATSIQHTQSILSVCPNVASIIQVPHDVLGAPLPFATKGFMIVHSIVKGALPRISAYLNSDPTIASLWKEETGVNPRDKNAIAKLLLASAVRNVPRGLVLFSTTKCDRIRAMAASVRNCEVASSQLQGLDRAVSRIKASGD